MAENTTGDRNSTVESRKGDPDGESTIAVNIAESRQSDAAAAESTVMDPEIWKDLRHHIDMPNVVYAKLPFREFFRLRNVCKEWNRVASERRGFKDLIPKPYFILNPSGIDEQLNGILSYNIASEHWCWEPTPAIVFSWRQPSGWSVLSGGLRL